jgi:hypothetical protein
MRRLTTDNNIAYTNALFKELDFQGLGLAIFTTGSEDLIEDGKTYKSLRKIYLELEDPTEYEVSKHFDSWAHWKKVRESSKIKPLVNEWREELEVKLRSKGVKGVYSKALDGDYQASKWLAEKGWVPVGAKKRGAPSKEEVVAEARKEARVIGIVDSHYERMQKKSR